MSSNYAVNRTFSDMMMPKCFEKMGRSQFQVADVESDLLRATDAFCVNALNGANIAVRVRRPHSRHSEQGFFTIRNMARGNTTEYDKILTGYADYMFYAMANKNCDDIAWFRFINLDVFRLAVFENMGKREYQKIHKSKKHVYPLHNDVGDNRDGTGYMVFNASNINFTKHKNWMVDASDDYKLPLSGQDASLVAA